MDKPEIPDLYADQVSITVHGGGVVLTLTRLEPEITPGPHEGLYVPVARVRLGHTTAHALIEVLNKTLAQAATSDQAAAQESTKTH